MRRLLHMVFDRVTSFLGTSIDEHSEPLDQRICVRLGAVHGRWKCDEPIHSIPKILCAQGGT
jgi:hypothetical protein